MIDMQQFERDGFAMTPSLFTSEEISTLINLIESHAPSEQKRGGVRDIMHRIPELRAIGNHPAIRTIVEQILGPGAFVVRSTLFDKTDAANWKVPWHQDVTIAIQQRRDIEDYGPWSIKGGIDHVQPPSYVLERMVTVRIHLDDCPASNGALRIMPGTHRLGKLNQNNVEPHVDEDRAICSEAKSGEVLVMRPLLLHASYAATLADHRRVLHFDFARDDLPCGLQWHMNHTRYDHSQN
jgi:ectoine hydroxylase-related dioxygenase (phytanoyl-CoA dioxygenase family)